MTRADLFAAVRPFAPQQRFTGPMVIAIDALADMFKLDATVAKAASPSGMRATQQAIDLIHSTETFQARAYKDPGSRDGLPITIGWGSTSDLDGKPIKLGDVWTRATGDAKFAQDLQKFEKGVTAALAGAPVTQGQFDALVSFAYNVGIQALKDSTLMRMHRAGDYAGAKGQFARWNKNDGKVMNGLIRRRAAEAAMYGASQ